MISGRRIVLGVGGGIAAYKAVVLARELLRRGAQLRVVMTDSATRFVGPVTFTGITGAPPVIDLWDAKYAGEIHVELAAWGEAIVVAPATANLLARMASGIADDALSATLLCSDKRVLVAPAMHHRMWSHAATRRNVARLREDGVLFAGPVSGPLASGEEGMGRMAEPDAIADALEVLFRETRDLSGHTVLISAGPTLEPVDPVRFLGNRSSGRMGYAIAERARQRGARVILVSGPVALAAPQGVERVSVRTAIEMQEAITSRLPDCDAVIMAAAVADFRPREAAVHKLKKLEGEETRVIELVRNPDILADLGASRRGARPVLVGFAVETENLVAAARTKLETKKVDLVVANHASVAFEGDDNEATLVTRDDEESTGRVSKHALADRILDRVHALLER
ncbi:bifunctional phosphopantothenoylcysteine decarboxylase/phosphopantothenate--cysteine ligase CoaBC [Sandaracinus amylolyticus]|uniref:Coenzyme A biosynthesis bifunctional protein CoaBC n=1 Tax=Sandaracinus amylolyticus TaxID=927083 RepID=A0A0F6YJJ9_9BACT|nr:bifunctional phosphopantothenoylcysteine decarboxylase/phosphopantothenate--cysteine ligase CoaBC [Sandaracinus amylolyticus]AKF07103.1 Phosphopantothenoylcysteine decarboxylase [Sandaracinus amylolyticus]